MYVIKKYYQISICLLLFVLGVTTIVYSQNNALVLNGAYIKFNSGTYANRVYLVVNAGSNSGISRSSGHIISEGEGNFIKWNTSDVNATTSFVFPFGYSTTDYIPVTINKIPVNTPSHIDNTSSLLLSTWTSAVDNTTWANGVTSMFGLAGANATISAIDRWWQVMVGANVSATADFAYRGAENTTSYTTGSFSAQEWDIPSTQWLTQTGSGAAITSGVTSVTGISLVPYGTVTSSPYVLTSISAPLPIELLSFDAHCNNTKTEIDWKTATESNVWQMELQRSFDLNNWQTIYYATPHNQSSMSYYNYSYEENESRTVYYRLKTTDNDGSEKISAVISNKPCNATYSDISGFYYNNHVHIITHNQMEEQLIYSLYDISGKKVCNGMYASPKGELFFEFPVHTLRNGIYLLRTENSKITYSQKLSIVR